MAWLWVMPSASPCCARWLPVRAWPHGDGHDHCPVCAYRSRDVGTLGASAAVGGTGYLSLRSQSDDQRGVLHPHGGSLHSERLTVVGLVRPVFHGQTHLYTAARGTSFALAVWVGLSTVPGAGTALAPAHAPGTSHAHDKKVKLGLSAGGLGLTTPRDLSMLFPKLGSSL